MTYEFPLPVNAAPGSVEPEPLAEQESERPSVAAEEAVPEVAAEARADEAKADKAMTEGAVYTCEFTTFDLLVNSQNL
jgi:hypothetical protein